MMNVKFPYIEETLRLNPDFFYHIVIENPAEYRKVLAAIQNQIDNDEEYLLCYQDDKEVKVSKEFFLISDLMHVPLDEKKINTLIQKDIASSINVQQKEEFETLMNRIGDYLLSLNIQYPLPLSYDSDLTLASFLKAIGLSAETDYDSYLSYLIGEIKKISFAFRIQNFILVNLHDFLNEEELFQFHEEMNKLEIKFIILSSHKPIGKSDAEYLIEIDPDLCELHYENKA